MIIDVGDILLRPFEDRDREALVAILGDPDLMRLVLDERPFARTEAERFIERHFSLKDQLGYATVSMKSSQEAIGFSGYRACRYLNEQDVEFGWVIARECHGRGYATALGQQLIRHALDVWRLPRILAACHPLNHASERVLRDKLHMRFERQLEPRPGFRRRVYSASLT